MSFGTFLSVVVPYLFLFFVLFIGVPYLISALVVGGYEYFKKEETADEAQQAQQKALGH
ncbi:hypothetical protein Fbal_0635 [Ferrimonas balearica DSM 9799]|uniref:Uncharacterized protein n=1 Tax=Ferrimonas balearica (strain DSM 9799 / CCM 4581 / KCTC 23876 / PAT) TaxID=550540 RepID=E1SR83_FERBD|nr:hypothetical protein [Ferrimonas balearica]MBY6018809.1 hypothetical protein [Halomonas denitrificans]ADN74848.1 hypothetical protein Fbal_0635 [Ferrimonas balearica DSM 9799]MBW3140649.1 hypothetical protein [Ferrimonas balearica]MBW3165374.1 hypothetical protein [Ferrimonas balearica]MBY5981416.1 hypothetical protein [Ferrimonas balearica]